MTGTRSYGKVKRRSHLKLIIVLVLLAGIVTTVLTVVNISSGDRRIRLAEQENRELRASVDNLRLAVSQHHNLPEIESRAAQLGLTPPDEDQIRTLSMAIE